VSAVGVVVDGQYFALVFGPVDADRRSLVFCCRRLSEGRLEITIDLGASLNSDLALQ